MIVQHCPLQILILLNEVYKTKLRRSFFVAPEEMLLWGGFVLCKTKANACLHVSRLPMSSNPPTSPVTLGEFLVPHKAEASLRLRNASFTLITLILLTSLLPLPSPLLAWCVVGGACTSRANSWPWWFCLSGV
jgi:hypothetical protein